MKCLIFVVLVSAASAYERIYSFDGSWRNETLMEIFTATFDGEEAGSGGEGGTPDCQMHYVQFNNKYLRGVTADDHESYNGTSYRKCSELCCRETRFKCQSFTYMKILRQCFIMNLTRDDPRFTLVDTPGWVHVQLVELQTTTAAPKKTLFVTPKYRSTTKTPFIPEDSSEKKPPLGSIGDPAKRVQPSLCSQECQNGGKCQTRKARDSISVDEGYCKCPEGYEGEQCEKETTTPVAAAGFQSWMIAVIVVAVVLLILLIIVCVVCQIQKRKTGQYRVFSALREWARKVRRPKKAVSSEDFFHGDDPYKHPTKNIPTAYDTIGSHGHSTSTSV